ncbi:MAG: alpha-amylase family glycosyl hydrolase [Clostridia bacterium]|nr:alpha-amylase family glycosyl hydrolase [Clostridia bacterium]
MNETSKKAMRIFTPVLVVLILVLSSMYVLAGSDGAVGNTASCSTDVIYQIITDRFLDGNTANNPTGALFDRTNLRKYHGGDWQGIINKINDNYFTNMGVTALWISPPVENITTIDPSNNSASYHGYWGRDFFKTNAYFGSSSDFANLVSAAHAKNLKVIIDFVPNHTSTCEYGSMVFPEDGRLYRNGTLISGFKTDTTNVFNHESWTDFSTLENGIYHSMYGLGDLNHLNSTVDTYMKDAINQWLNWGVDGIRVDAVKHMPKGWQKSWLNSIYTNKPVFVFGEWYHGGTTNDATMTDFANTSGMSLLDFRFANTVRNVIGSGTGTMYDLNTLFTSTNTDFDEVNNQVTFIDNHDVSRFYTLASSNQRKVAQAYAIMLTSRGVPTIYYGTEQYLTGSTDPDNRKDMPSFSTTTNAYQVIGKIAPLRKTNPALAYGTTTEKWINNDVIVYERKFGNSVVLTAVNRSQTASYNISGLLTSLPAGTYTDVLTGILNGNSITVSSTGSVTAFDLGAGEVGVWQYTNGSTTPIIGSAAPTMGKPTNVITIDGRGFGTTAGQVKFGTTNGTIVSWNNEQIKVRVPTLAAGLYNVTVVNSSGTTSNIFDKFEVLSGTQVTVRFKVNNATTSLGTNVYLVGSVSELGNWAPASAIGPLFNNTSTIGVYPTWFYDVNVPAGTTISFKFIKKDSAGNATWEGGSNHTYTTPSSGTGTVVVDWQN